MPSLSTTENTRLARIAARTCSGKPYRKSAQVATSSSADSASNFIHVDENTLKLPTATHSFPPPTHPLGPSSFPCSSRLNAHYTSVETSRAPVPRSVAASGGIPPTAQSTPLATRNAQSIPADVPGYLTYEQYKQVEDRWIAGLNPRKRARCLIDQQTFDTIWDVLEDPENQSISNAQTRWWIRKMFTFSYPQTTLARASPSIPTSNLAVNPHALDPIVVHDKKPLAIKEHMYQILCSCHAMCGHGGRDRTCAVIREHWAWIPKELVALFVRNCPTCLVKKTGNPDFGVLVESQKRQAENKEKVAIESVVAVLGAAVVKDGLALEVVPVGAESAITVAQVPTQAQAPLVASNFNNSVSGYVVGPYTDTVADLDCTAASSSASGLQLPSQTYLPYPALSSGADSPQLSLPGRYDSYHPHYFGNPVGFAGDSFQSNAVPPKTIFDSPEPNMFMFLNNDVFSPALGCPLPPAALDSSTTNLTAQSIQRSHPMSLQCLLNSSMGAVPAPTSAAPQTKPFGRGSLSEKRGIVLPPVVPTAINAVLGLNGLTSTLPVLQDLGTDVGRRTGAEDEGVEAGTRVERRGEDVTMDVEAHGSCKEIVGENESTPMLLLYPGSSFERRSSGEPQHATPSKARQHHPTTFDCPPVSPVHLGNVKHVTRRNFDVDVDYAQGSSSDAGTSPGRDSDLRGTKEAKRWGALMFDSSSSESVPYSFEGQAQLRDEMSFEPGTDRGSHGLKAPSSWSHCDWLESLDINTRDRLPLMFDEATPKINGHGNGSWLYEVDLGGTESSSGSDPFLASMEGGVGMSGG